MSKNTSNAQIAGLLVYGEGVHAQHHGKADIFCSPWCIEGEALTSANSGYVRLPIVQPKLPIETARPRSPRVGPPDPVMMNILDSTMVSICREMGIFDEDVLLNDLQ